jgi:hypothetical protein
MPTPFDLLTQKVDPPDPEDQLDQTVDQDQGANLAGGPEPDPNAQPQIVPPSSPNVPGPLAALAAKPVKPKIKLLSPPKKSKPHIKLKLRAKPHIKLKLGGSNALL